MNNFDTGGKGVGLVYLVTSRSGDWIARENAETMTSILRRPLDLLIVVSVFFFLLVAVTIGKSFSNFVGIGSPTFAP
jgi:hypothetical protein